MFFDILFHGDHHRIIRLSRDEQQLRLVENMLKVMKVNCTGKRYLLCYFIKKDTLITPRFSDY